MAEETCKARSDDEWLDEITEWDAAITKQQMEVIESEMQNPAHGVNRRILLAILTMDSEKIFEICESDLETWFDAFRCTASTVGKLKAPVKSLSAAHNRLIIGLCAIDTAAADAPFSKKEFFDAIHEAKGDDVNDSAVEGKTDN